MGCSPVNNKNLNLRTYILDIKDSPIARQSICKRNRKMVIGEENMVLSNNIKIIVEENMDPFAKYSNMTLIKEGRFSAVYTVVHSVTGKKRVMKIFHKKRIKDEFTQDDLANQIEILKNLSHPNIIKLFEVFTYNFNIYLSFISSSKTHLSNEHRKPFELFLHLWSVQYLSGIFIFPFFMLSIFVCSVCFSITVSCPPLFCHFQSFPRSL